MLEPGDPPAGPHFLPQQEGGTRKSPCPCFSPARHSAGWGGSRGAPPQRTPAFTAGPRHSQATAQRTHRTSHGAERSQVCEVQLASPARGRVPGLHARGPPRLPETGRENRKVNSQPLSPRFHHRPSTYETRGFQLPCESHQPSLTASNTRLSL